MSDTLPIARTPRTARSRPASKLRKHLKDLTRQVDAYLTLHDREMKKPATYERGRAIADLSNRLEFANDMARHFGLGEKFPLKKAGR